ncbi:MAG TPA: hypothetical protein VLY21_01295, partial [Nitrososphaerales archaeon]|nr:hypothetical protein [Nitrososphaerales archaeon]
NSLSATMSPGECTPDSATDNQIAMSSLNQAMVGVRGGALSFTVYWYRIRTAPPSNVMPVTTVGNIVLLAGAPGAAYYEVASGPVPCSVTVDTSLTPSSSKGSTTISSAQAMSSTCLVTPAFASPTNIAAGPWLVDLFASATSGGALTLSLQVETGTGTVVSSVFSGSTSSIPKVEGEVKNYFSGSAVTVPSGDYLVLKISILVGGNQGSATIYWGSGQQSNFQLPNTYGYILSLTNPGGIGGSASWLVDLGYVGSSNNRMNNMTVFLEAPVSKQIVIGTGIGSPTQPNGFGPQLTLAPGTTMYIGMGIVANSAGTTLVTITLKIQVPPTASSASTYCQDTIAITVN